MDVTRPAVIAIVGAGPRGTGLLERIGANVPELFGGRALEIHVIDPFPRARAGSGATTSHPC